MNPTETSSIATYYKTVKDNGDDNDGEEEQKPQEN
jgi:hypothetical protein